MPGHAFAALVTLAGENERRAVNRGQTRVPAMAYRAQAFEASVGDAVCKGGRSCDLDCCAAQKRPCRKFQPQRALEVSCREAATRHPCRFKTTRHCESGRELTGSV